MTTTTIMILFIQINDLYIHVIELDVEQKTTTKQFVKKRPQHPCDRLKQKTKKLEFDAETLTEIPFINVDILLDTKESSAKENKIIDHIIRNLSADNNRYCIEHQEGLNTFKILENPQQKDKDRLFELILNTEKDKQIKQQIRKSRT